tara:strand:+ start:4214 stop:5083 length:870 start_codon:yes stop_codon:yes gene_type:complete
MAFLPFAAVGALLASSKKVRKEIKRFGKRVKKQLKRTMKSKAFKVIAAAALIATGVYFVGGMMGATLPGITTAGGTAAAGTTAATAGATTAGATTATAAASGNILSNTAAAIVNGARTAANAVYGAGQSTTAFLSEGFTKITGEASKETVKDTAIDTTFDSSLESVAGGGGEIGREAAKATVEKEGKRGFLGGKPFSEQTTVEKLKTTKNVVSGVQAAGSLLAGAPDGAEGSSFAGFDPEGFVGDAVFTPAPMSNNFLQQQFPLVDFNALVKPITSDAFLRTKQVLGQP